MLKPALQLWLENGFKPSLTATEVQDNPGRYVHYGLGHEIVCNVSLYSIYRILHVFLWSFVYFTNGVYSVLI